jgi:hypothetical protein
MRLVFTAIAFAVFFHCSSWANENAVLSGPQLKACAVALLEYERFARKAPVEHYTVWVTESPEGIEVAFIPYGPDDKVTTLGGASESGDGIQYLISKDTFKVVRVTFSR